MGKCACGTDKEIEKVVHEHIRDFIGSVTDWRNDLVGAGFTVEQAERILNISMPYVYKLK
jgi:hypothetical protein